jgi:ERI1 exoribonuclease 3
MAAAESPKGLDYYLVLDFEATCDEGKQPFPQEIIEFPVIKVNGRTLETEDIFHTYISPEAHPILTPFCTQLTGITQDKVDGQPTLSQALNDFHSWLGRNGLLESDVSFSFVTCGDWDLKTMLPGQAKYFNISLPGYFNTWINIKKVFQKVKGVHPKGMPDMLTRLGLNLDGRHHSGIDDSRNIAKILIELAKIDPNIQPTWRPKS